MKYIWHSICVFHEKSDLHVRTLNFKVKSWLICLWLWGLLVCSKLYCDWSVHHWNFPNFIMKGKYWYATEIMSLSSCIKVIPQYCTATPVLCITSHNWAVCIQAFWEHGIIFFQSMNDVNVWWSNLYKLSYLYFLLDNIAVQIFPPKVRKIKKKCFVIKNIYLITSLLWHQKVFKERWGHYTIIVCWPLTVTEVWYPHLASYVHWVH